MRKPRKVGHIDWHLAQGAEESTAKTHASGRLPSPPAVGPKIDNFLGGCDVLGAERPWSRGRNMGSVWDAPGTTTHMPQDLQQVLSPP